MTSALDAVVIGSGPNGLAAAITLAGAGLRVRVLEARDTPGGGCRTAELTLPGFRHDVCSAIHPLAVISPFLRELRLERHGLDLVHPRIALAHSLGEGRAALLHHDIDTTVAAFGDHDAHVWRTMIGGHAARATDLFGDILTLPRPPRHPVTLARFAAVGALPVSLLARRFLDEGPRALLGGMAAHGMEPLNAPGTGALGLILAIAAHAAGWPAARGGSGAIIDALCAELRARGGDIECGRTVRSLRDLPASRYVLFDTSVQSMLDISGAHLPPLYRGRARRFPDGPGVFKIDYALSGPIPWLAAACGLAGTVHVGGTLDDVAASERAVHRGTAASEPFCLVAQQSCFDDSRAPEGHHTAWVYCHVPNASRVDMTAAIEAVLERHAPGFGDVVLARHVTTPADLQAYNANYRGGDIGAGRQDLFHLLARPLLRANPYSTPNPRIWLCSAATPPGGGVHGMSGHNAARAILRRR